MTKLIKDINDLPNEIVLTIFLYLSSPKDLINCSEMNKQWNFVSNTNLLWHRICAQRWEGKRGMNLELQHRVDYSDLHASLTMKEIKAILKKREVYTKGLLERSEFTDLLTTSTPRPLYGKWSPKWKASYIVAEKDLKRTVITKSELCSTGWTFRIKQWPEEQPSAKCRFFPDYSFRSDLFEHEMKWRFYDGKVQVEQYPAHSFFRTGDNWGWGLENSHVIMYAD